MKKFNLLQQRSRIHNIKAFLKAGQTDKTPVRNRFFLFRPASPFIIFKIISIFKSLNQKNFSNFNQYRNAKAIIFFLKGYENK